MPCLKLFVPGLQNELHERQLKAALAAEPGVYGVVASYAANCVELDFEDDEVTIDRLIEVAQAAGFEARLAG